MTKIDLDHVEKTYQRNEQLERRVDEARQRLIEGRKMIGDSLARSIIDDVLKGPLKEATL